MGKIKNMTEENGWEHNANMLSRIATTGWVMAELLTALPPPMVYNGQPRVGQLHMLGRQNSFVGGIGVP